jgi:hypothetical protein
MLAARLIPRICLSMAESMQLGNPYRDKYPSFPSMISCFHTKKDATWPESGYLDHWSGRLDVWPDQHLTTVFRIQIRILPSTSVLNPDLWSGVFLTLDPDPGSRIGFFWIPDLGSQPHIFLSIVTNFWVKSSIILWKLAQILFFQDLKNNTIFNFVKFVATKKALKANFFHLPI